MKKLTTLVCALAALAFSATASAQNDDFLDEDHVDDPDNGKYVFWDEEEMIEFLEELGSGSLSSDDEGGGMLDSCTQQRPIAYAVATYHFMFPYSHWHVDTNVAYHGQDVYYDYYRVCLNKNTHMYSNVYGLRANWRTTLSDACDYCELDNWNADYKTNPYGNWTPFAVTDCSYVWPPNNQIVYWGEKPSGLGGYSYETHQQDIARFSWQEWVNTKIIGLTNCP